MRKLNCIWAIVFLLGILTLSGCNNSNLGLSSVSKPNINNHSDKVTTIQSFNEDPPKFVYRVDKRPPEVIFKSGFQLRGDGSNNNLADHIRFSPHNSAFVSTSSSDNFIRHYLTSLGHTSPNSYIYTIRATNNFYSTTTSLNAQPDALALRRSNPFLSSLVDDEFEWASHGAIPTNTIESVESFRWDPNSNQFVSLGSHSNPNYIDADTHANPDPWPEFFINRPLYNTINTGGNTTLTDMCNSTKPSKDNKNAPYIPCEHPVPNLLKPIGPYQIACVSTGFLFMAKVTCSILTNESHHVGNFGAIAGGLAFLGSESSHNAYFKVPVSGLAGSKVGGVNMILGAFGPLVELQLGPNPSDPTGYTVTSLQGVQIAGFLGSVTGYFY